MPGMSVPILLYHAIHPQRSVVSLDPSTFAFQMAWLQENGFKTLTQRELALYLTEGKALPEKCVALTFDDGYQSLYDHAFPILSNFGFTATIFLVSGYCAKYNDWPGQPAGIPRWPLLNWQQIQEMNSHGIEFGAHSLSHARLDVLGPVEMSREILDSKQILEERLGHEIVDFAYPYGRYNARIKEFVSQLFISACTTRTGLLGSTSDRFAMERIEITYLQLPWIYQGLDRGWFPFYLNSRGVLRKLGGVLLRRKWY